MQKRAKPMIDQVQLAPVRQSLPVSHTNESFRYFMVRWDIVKARYLIQKRNTAPDVLLVAITAHTYGLDTPRDSDKAVYAVYIDEARAMSEAIATTIPVILALIQGDEGEEPKPLLIDGLHRLYKAFQEGKETIPCYALTPQEERLCRI